MATPKVSVVIPSWNSESQLKQNLPYVFKAAAAVKAEIVVVDDASAFTDGTIGTAGRLFIGAGPGVRTFL
ncbi:MAG: hypothetical protein UX64_C0001G0001 [Microgenomates group bacterium GW2011_GWC2_46_7]|nr:MAG: hypothetical protein UX64_C0001G0001 [Microgenomates group bacterium GW2011_GWC2_46_7]